MHTHTHTHTNTQTHTHTHTCTHTPGGPKASKKQRSATPSSPGGDRNRAGSSRASSISLGAGAGGGDTVLTCGMYRCTYNRPAPHHTTHHPNPLDLRFRHQCASPASASIHTHATSTRTHPTPHRLDLRSLTHPLARLRTRRCRIFKMTAPNFGYVCVSVSVCAFSRSRANALFVVCLPLSPLWYSLLYA